MSDFDVLSDRRGTGSVKWDVKEGELPMWIADMDFPVSEPIRKAIENRASIPYYGYTEVSQRWKRAISSWWERRHDVRFKEDDIIFSTGVVPSISACVERLTAPGDEIITMTPVYDIFFHSIENHWRRVLESPLKYADGAYSIDFADLENKMAHEDATLLILCNPHNPIGRVFSEGELKRIGSLARKHGVTVISDEIHCDLTDPGVGYVPYAKANPDGKGFVTLVSASKAFNIAGLQGSAAIVMDEALKEKVDKALNAFEVAEPNFFVQEAMIAAFDESEAWLDEARRRIKENKDLVAEFLEKELPELRLVKGEATYLLWIDISRISEDSDDFAASLRKNTGLILSSGSVYRGNGKGFVRMNVATQKERVLDGLKRLKEGVHLYK
jgi:cystathionine beta-lyase